MTLTPINITSTNRRNTAFDEEGRVYSDLMGTADWRDLRSMGYGNATVYTASGNREVNYVQATFPQTARLIGSGLTSKMKDRIKEIGCKANFVGNSLVMVLPDGVFLLDNPAPSVVAHLEMEVTETDLDNFREALREDPSLIAERVQYNSKGSEAFRDNLLRSLTNCEKTEDFLINDYGLKLGEGIAAKVKIPSIYLANDCLTLSLIDNGRYLASVGISRETGLRF